MHGAPLTREPGVLDLRPRPVRLLGVATAAVAVGVAAEVLSRSTVGPTDVVLDLVTGWAVTLSGLIAWRRRPESRVGPLLVASGLAWFLGNLIVARPIEGGRRWAAPVTCPRPCPDDHRIRGLGGRTDPHEMPGSADETGRGRPTSRTPVPADPTEVAVYDVAQARGRARLGQRGDGLRRSIFETGPLPPIALIAAEVIVIALLTFRLAGHASAIYHAFYLPVVLAANRFRWRGALVTGVVAGLLSGPLRPVNDAAGPAQQTWAWSLRLLAFCLVGLLVAWLSRESASSIATVIRERGKARALREAIRHGKLRALYQPITDLGSGAVVGFEALCRWTHPVDGPIPPSDFIPLAERTGVVVPLGRYMLRRTALQAAAWRAAGGGPLLLTVNVSAEQLVRADLVEDVAAALEAAQLPPSALCLEITETAVIRDPVAAMANVRAAHELGVLVALDDFGTGHSSLTYLRDFPIDIIKIDKSFVDDVDADPQAFALVRTIIELAHALGATTVAEGIERPAQLAALQLLGCDSGQGYLLGRPAPPEDLTW